MLGRVRSGRDGVTRQGAAGFGLPPAGRFSCRVDRCLRRGNRAVPDDDRQPVHWSPRGYRVIQQISGIGPTFAAIFIAEIGDIARFAWSES
jgi:hypothetical protein